jgi:hypothetical protein
MAALKKDWTSNSATLVNRQRPLRDLIMMRMINSITDKPNWTDKIQDQGITSRWRKEFLESGEDVAESMMERVS